VGCFYLSVAADINHWLQAFIKAIAANFLGLCITRYLESNFRQTKKGKDHHRSSVIRYTKYLQAGLVFCSGGDFMLHMEIHPSLGHRAWFLVGLISFLIGHIYFIWGMKGRINEL